jgi:hypothetical protein
MKSQQSAMSRAQMTTRAAVCCRVTEMLRKASKAIPIVVEHEPVDVCAFP